MNAPETLKYTKDHEWASIEDDNRVRVGITDYAQDALGDIVFVQLPTVGTEVQAGLTFSEVESTKSVSDIYAPVSGRVVEVNSSLEESPQKLNEDPYEAGWICIIEASDSGDFDSFLDAAGYQALVDA